MINLVFATSSIIILQLTPDNSNLQGKSKKGSSYQEFEENSREYGKNSFYCIVNILITFNCRNIKWKLKDTSRL